MSTWTASVYTVRVAIFSRGSACVNIVHVLARGHKNDLTMTKIMMVRLTPPPTPSLAVTMPCCLSICLALLLSVCPSVRLSVCPSVRLSPCLPPYFPPYLPPFHALDLTLLLGFPSMRKRFGINWDKYIYKTV